MGADVVDNWTIVRYSRESEDGDGKFEGYQAIFGADAGNTYPFSPRNVTVAYIEKSAGQVVVRGVNRLNGLHIDRIVDSFNFDKVTPQETLGFCYEHIRNLLAGK